MEWNKSGVKNGLLIIIIGGIMFLVGLGLFLSVFFSVGRGISGFGSRGMFPSSPTFPPIGRAAIGMGFVAVGSILVKVGLGISVVTNAVPLSRWTGRLFQNMFNPNAVSEPIVCPQCSAQNEKTDRYCSQCGKSLG